MSKEDYSEYYIQGSDHYLIPKNEFNKLFNEIVNWREENKQSKERINKARKHIELLKEFDEANFGEGAYSKDWEELLEILKGDSNEK